MSQFQKNFRTERQKDRRMKDGQTLIHRTFLAMARGLIKAPPYPEFQVSKKIYICFKYSIAFPVKFVFKETKM